MADSEAKEAAPDPADDLKSASSPDHDPEAEVETLKNISETGDFTEKEVVENQEKEKVNINNQTTTSSQHEASIKPDKEGISKELSQNNVNADTISTTTTTTNNNKS